VHERCGEEVFRSGVTGRCSDGVHLGRCELRRADVSGEAERPAQRGRRVVGDAAVGVAFEVVALCGGGLKQRLLMAVAVRRLAAEGESRPSSPP
jgi:hypothetical protein